MNTVNRAHLRFVLMALLPKTGECLSAGDLATMAQVPASVVDDVLSDEWMLGHVGYGCNAGGVAGYCAIRRGDALPCQGGAR